jgi:outer membrane protein assembly factor BamB
VSSNELVFLGVGSHAVALDAATGTEVWRTKVKSSGFVTIHTDGRQLYVGSGGEVWCLDPVTGAVRWHNKLPRLGMGIVSFQGGSVAAVAARQAAARHAAAAGAAS